MKLKLVAAISALAIPALAHAQQGGPQPKVPKPTKADAQNVVQIVTSDKVKMQAYCDLTKLEDQVKAVQQNTDPKTVETLTKQAEALIDKLGPEYFKLMDGLASGINSARCSARYSLTSAVISLAARCETLIPSRCRLRLNALTCLKLRQHVSRCRYASMGLV